jgi:hypothetical protein
MKKILSSLGLAALMAGCGGGSGDSEVSSAKSQTMYGFDANGAAYAAVVDLRSSSYEYSQISTDTGKSNGSVLLKMASQADNPNVYKVYDHGQHLLAMDISQTILLATTKVSSSATAEPTVYAAQPLINFSEISGNYYQTQWGPFGIRLNVTSSGTVSVDCKNFGVTQVTGEVSNTYDSCTTISVSNARLEPLSSPYWKLTYEIKYKDLTAYSVNTSTVLFAKGSTGRVAYIGENSTKFCYDNGICSIHNHGSTIWQETQNFISPANYSGDWLFNRQGATSSSINLSASGTGVTSSGLAVSATFSKELTNIDPTRNALDVSSYLNTISPVSNPLVTTGAIATNIYGRSELKSLGGNISTERSLINNSALFDKVALETKTFTLMPNGGSGPYVVPFTPDEVKRLAKYDVFIESAQANSIVAASSVLLAESVGYSFDPLSGAIMLRSPLPVFDDNKRSLRLVVKAHLTPVGITASPIAWGVRIR